MFVVLKQNDLPSGTKLKLFVGNKYENNDFVNVYSYRNNKLYLLKNKIKLDQKELQKFSTSCIIKNKKKKKSNYDDCEELSDDYSLFEIKNNEQTIKNTNNNDNIN